MEKYNYLKIMDRSNRYNRMNNINVQLSNYLTPIFTNLTLTQHKPYENNGFRKAFIIKNSKNRMTTT